MKQFTWLITRHRLLRLLKVLASPEKEIVGRWEIGGVIITSIELVDNDEDFQLNCIYKQMEVAYVPEQFTTNELLELIQDLEKILLN